MVELDNFTTKYRVLTVSHLWTGKEERKQKPSIRIFLKGNSWEVEVRCRVLTAVT